MPRIAMLAAVATFGALVLGAVAGRAAPLHADASATLAAAAEFSAQSRSRLRARPQLRINPRYPYRNFHTIYPLPYSYEYPGPNAVRRCVDWYATELRPSGTVVVPRMRCWWVRG